MSEGKLEKVDKAFDSIKSIIWGVILIAIAVGIVVFFVNRQTGEKTENTTSNNNSNSTMTISEAQTKCMLMEEADMVNLMGEPFGDATTKKAEKHCLSLWDMTQNPENTEEKFIDMIADDWELQKDIVLEGFTLEEYYNEINNSL